MAVGFRWQWPTLSRRPPQSGLPWPRFPSHRVAGGGHPALRVGRQKAPTQHHRHFCLWLQADLQPPKIDFRLSPNSGHSEAHAGLLLVTQTGLHTVHGAVSGAPLR